MNRFLPYILAAVAILAAYVPQANAQFRKEAFSQNYNEEITDNPDSAALFSFREYFGGLAHKNELKIGTCFAGSTVFIGGQQIYQKQYWKLPIIYGGLGATVGLGFHFRNKYNQSLSAYENAVALDPATTVTPDYKSKGLMTTMFVAGGLVYWATLMDGVVTYKKDRHPHPGTATLYSVLCPGLGQIYNGEYWKVPIYWGCLVGAYHYLHINQMQYDRFKRIYVEASDNTKVYEGGISASTAQYYRDTYREYRDYSILALAAFYLLQCIDANVFAYMQDFEVSENLSMKIKPAVITPDTQFAMSPSAVGLSLGFRF